MGVYAPGGHYLPHYDDFDVLDPQAVTGAGVWVGNRLATAMAYLSEVQGRLVAGTLTIRFGIQRYFAKVCWQLC